MKIKAQRWPWQGPVNPVWERFGGGWKYKFGIDIGTNTIIINLIWGLIRISRK